MTEKQFSITWVIDICATNHKEAAEKALSIQRDKDSIATVFLVSDGSSEKQIDLSGR